MSDKVRDYLRARGCAEHVIKGGLGGLVGQWENTVTSVARGYEFGLHDYLNDLDARQLIYETLPIAGRASVQKYADRVHRADEKMRKLVTPIDNCIWGNAAASEHGWSAEKNWWYFSKPKTAGKELLEDLDREIE
jgi:hypothetical protein